MKGSFAKRAALLDELSGYFLTQLVHLGGYCTALQAEALGVAETAKRVRGRLRMLERLGFLRRVTKYPVIYQVTKSTTRLHGPDSSTRRRHMPSTVQARLLGVQFYLEARTWPATFMFDHEDKIVTLQNAGCPLSVLPRLRGKYELTFARFPKPLVKSRFRFPSCFFRSNAIMARVCDVCGKGPQFGNRISHAHNLTRRRWNVNLRPVKGRLKNERSGARRLRVCASCLRSGKVIKA